MDVYTKYLDRFLCIAAAMQLFSALLGAVVSVHDDWAKRHRALVLALFAALGVIGMIATIAQSVKSTREAEAAEGHLSGSLHELAGATAETNRVAKLNTALQGKLLHQNDVISGLAEKSVNSVMGGTGYCYLVHYPPDDDSGTFTVVQQGEFPIYEIHVRALDMTSLNAIEKHPSTDSAKQTPELATLFDIPSMAPGTANIGTVHIPIRHTDQQDYNIFFSARNGIWTELLRMRKVDGLWAQAILVKREFANVKNRKGPKLPLTIIDGGYPLPVNWN